MLQTATTAFVLGLLSSLHCVGMCGPLLMALPTHRLNRTGQLLSPFLYHTGRILTYSLFGALFGLLGRGVYLAGWQQGFSITLGVLILLLFLTRRLLPARSLLPLSARRTGQALPITRFYARFQQWLGRLWQSPSIPKFFLLGMANGLLPCGMVYLAVAGALTRNTVPEAIGFMAIFGAGTLPLLIGAQFAATLLAPALRGRLRRALPVVTILVALLLILRGLNLGIPFLSPLLATAPGHTISCH
jgi:sulfite exporter TauE/SafE